MRREIRKFPPHILPTLKSYVYAYVDPRDGTVFYIGKGKGQRAFEHRGDRSKPRIRELQDLGLSPRIDLLKWGLSDAEALIVEATAIDLYGIDELDNRVAGHHGMRASVQQVVSELAAKPVEIGHAAILFKLSRQFRYDMTVGELYDATRAAWRLNVARAETADYAMAVYRNVIREVYVPEAWVRGHSTIQASGLRTWEDESLDERWEFVGRLAPQTIRRRYLDRELSEPWIGQTPFKYVNC